MRTLNRSSLSLSTLAAALAISFAGGTAFAQTGSVQTERTAKHCTTATLSTDPSAPCADDVAPAPGVRPAVVGNPVVPLNGPATPTAPSTIPGSRTITDQTSADAPLTPGGAGRNSTSVGATGAGASTGAGTSAMPGSSAITNQNTGGASQSPGGAGRTTTR